MEMYFGLFWDKKNVFGQKESFWCKIRGIMQQKMPIREQKELFWYKNGPFWDKRESILSKKSQNGTKMFYQGPKNPF